jgi:hypothetical protein
MIITPPRTIREYFSRRYWRLQSALTILQHTKDSLGYSGEGVNEAWSTLRDLQNKLLEEYYKASSIDAPQENNTHVR